MVRFGCLFYWLSEFSLALSLSLITGVYYIIRAARVLVEILKNDEETKGSFYAITDLTQKPTASAHYTRIYLSDHAASPTYLCPYRLLCCSWLLGSLIRQLN